jgi:hypothetical protein
MGSGYWQFGSPKHDLEKAGTGFSEKIVLNQRAGAPWHLERRGLDAHICGPDWLTLPWRFAHKRARPVASTGGLPDFSVIAGLISAVSAGKLVGVVERGSVPSGKGS